jgi:hypothetical protein
MYKWLYHGVFPRSFLREILYCTNGFTIGVFPRSFLREILYCRNGFTIGVFPRSFIREILYCRNGFTIGGFFLVAFYDRYCTVGSIPGSRVQYQALVACSIRLSCSIPFLDVQYHFSMFNTCKCCSTGFTMRVVFWRYFYDYK